MFFLCCTNVKTIEISMCRKTTNGYTECNYQQKQHKYRQFTKPQVSNLEGNNRDNERERGRERGGDK